MEEEKKPPTTTTTKTTEVHGGVKEEKNDVDLPFKSPYVEYGNLEDYKMKAYGAEGHEEPKVGQGGGSTDAPTPSGGVGRGGGAASTDVSSTNAINRQGVP